MVNPDFAADLVRNGPPPLEVVEVDRRVVGRKLSRLQRKMLRLALRTYEAHAPCLHDHTSTVGVLEEVYGWRDPYYKPGPRSDRNSVVTAIGRLTDRGLVQPVRRQWSSIIDGYRLTDLGYSLVQTWTPEETEDIDRWVVREPAHEGKPHGPWPMLSDEEVERIAGLAADAARRLLTGKVQKSTGRYSAWVRGGKAGVDHDAGEVMLRFKLSC